MARSRPHSLLNRLAAGNRRNVGFTEFCRLVEAFGFNLRRVSGSHHIYTHPKVPRHHREAKPYQIGQFFDIVQEYGLRMDDEQ